MIYFHQIWITFISYDINFACIEKLCFDEDILAKGNNYECSSLYISDRLSYNACNWAKYTFRSAVLICHIEFREKFKIIAQIKMQQNVILAIKWSVNHSNWNKFVIFSKVNKFKVKYTRCAWMNVIYRMNMNMYKRRSLSTLTRQCFPFITGLLPCVLVNTESNSFDSKNSICKFVTFSGFIDCCVPVENPAPNIHLKTHSSIITFEEKKLIWYHQIFLMLRVCDVFCVPIVTGDDVWSFVVFVFHRVCDTHTLKAWKCECGWDERGKHSVMCDVWTVKALSTYKCWVSFSDCDVHPCVLHVHGWDKLLF